MVEAEALLVTGTVGSGKTTTVDRVADRLGSRGIAFAAIDLDAVRRFGPTPVEDPFGFEMELRNLRPLVENYLSNGACRIVLAGVCESRRDRARYAAVLGVPMIVCRLRVPSVDVQQRLRARHLHDEPGLRWHLARAGELETVLDQSDAADVEVVVDGLSRDEVADAVLDAVGWRN